jgi:hypothetical protein
MTFSLSLISMKFIPPDLQQRMRSFVEMPRSKVPAAAAESKKTPRATRKEFGLRGHKS